MHSHTVSRSANDRHTASEGQTLYRCSDQGCLKSGIATLLEQMHHWGFVLAQTEPIFHQAVVLTTQAREDCAAPQKCQLSVLGKTKFENIRTEAAGPARKGQCCKTEGAGDKHRLAQVPDVACALTHSLSFRITDSGFAEAVQTQQIADHKSQLAAGCSTESPAPRSEPSRMLAHASKGRYTASTGNTPATRQTRGLYTT